MVLFVSPLARRLNAHSAPRLAVALPRQRQPPRSALVKRREARAPPSPVRSRRRPPSYVRVRWSPAIARTSPLEQHDQQREDQNVEAQFRDRWVAERAIEGDEVEE